MQSNIFRIIILIVFWVFSIDLSYSQQLTEITVLNSTINESSGLIYLNQKLITHNDSGGEAALYEFDSIGGNISRKVVVKNASNIDWEDLCYDENYIYIGDFGNNAGSRTDLKIYRIPIVDYFENANNEVDAEIIHFNYSDQTDFTPTFYTTNFDAEAMIAYNDSLYIFTKNWSDLKSNIYSISKNPGSYQIKKIDVINPQSLVSGAAYNTESNAIVLTAYNFFSAYIIEITQFISNQFSGGTIEKYAIQPLGSIQIESIAAFKSNQFYLTSEENTSGNSKLYRLKSKYNILAINDIEADALLIYPNPAKSFVNIRCNNLLSVEIYDSKGVLLKTSNKRRIDINDLNKGVYFVSITQKKNENPIIRKLIID